MFKTISSKLTFLFSFALVAIVLLFISTHQVIHNKAVEDELARLSLVAAYANQLGGDYEKITEFLKNVNFYRLQNNLDIRCLRNHAEHSQSYALNDGTLHGFFAKGVFYVDFVDQNGTESLYQSAGNLDKFSTVLIAACLVSICILAIIYFLLMRHLKPIHLLTTRMRSYSRGQKFEPIKISANDEIKELAHEIAQATDRINNLITSRQFFLRAIMHELKTPIGKGKIINALPASKLNKKRMEDVFTRLDMLVNEFAQVEKVLSLDYEPQLKDYRCSLVYEQAIDFLMCEDAQSFCVDFGNDEVVRVDLNLFSMMLKNMLDNALKYCTRKPIYVKFNSESLCVSNYGRPLDEGFKNLSLAFIQADESQPGLGLGLYLIGRIARMHNCQFDYYYQDNMHKFIINFGKGKQ